MGLEPCPTVQDKRECGNGTFEGNPMTLASDRRYKYELMAFEVTCII